MTESGNAFVTKSGNDYVAKIIGNFVEKTQLTNDKIAGDSDYVNADGLIVCGVCHVPRECVVKEFGKVPCLCACGVAIRDAERAQMIAAQRRIAIRALIYNGISDQKYLGHLFISDDRRNPESSDICKNYCDHWIEMFKENIGIMFYGGYGTGKTFLACCIATELLEHGVPVCISNLPDLIKKAGDFDDRGFVNKLAEFDLLVIDDVGVESESGYSLEQTYMIIDARYRTGKPLICTTNLTPDELRQTQNSAKARIYDRIKEMCVVPIKMAGVSRRSDIANEKRNNAMKLLKG